MSSFVRFVLKYKKDDSAWGDVAKDVAADGEIKRTWNWRAFNKHVEDKASASAYAVMEEMRDAYEKTLPPKPCKIVD